MFDLRTIRKTKGLTQQDLAGLIGMTQSTLAEVETGKRTPQMRTIKKVESLLGPAIDWRKTLAGEDQAHIMRHMVTLINEQAEGVQERIRFCRQCLQVIEDTINHQP